MAYSKCWIKWKLLLFLCIAFAVDTSYLELQDKILIIIWRKTGIFDWRILYSCNIIYLFWLIFFCCCECSPYGIWVFDSCFNVLYTTSPTFLMIKERVFRLPLMCSHFSKLTLKNAGKEKMFLRSFAIPFSPCHCQTCLLSNFSFFTEKAI